MKNWGEAVVRPDFVISNILQYGNDIRTLSEELHPEMQCLVLLEKEVLC